jgi:hypothetical protein
LPRRRYAARTAEAHRLELVAAWRAAGGDLAGVAAYLDAFLERIEAARRPLEEWLDANPARPA